MAVVEYVKYVLQLNACNLGHVETFAVHEKEPVDVVINVIWSVCHFDHIRLRCFEWNVSVLFL